MTARTRSPHRRLATPAVVAPATVSVVSPAPLDAQVQRDPLAARLITDDIPRFWQAFDARAALGTARAMDLLYFRPGSAGLKDFIRLRLRDPQTLATSVDNAARYYESARASTLQIARDEPKIREAFITFKALYPDAVFPDVYFLIGRLSTGGTTGPSGLLIGAEMYGRTTDEALAGLTDWHRQVLAGIDRVPTIVAHELIHYQQTLPGRTLLAQALREGTADFVAELLTGDNINAHVHAWVHAVPGREQALWAEFQGAMHGRDLSGWFSSDDVTERPKDLGYFIGYRVAQAYYATQADKAAALRTLFRGRDLRRIVRESGYGAEFAR